MTDAAGSTDTATTVPLRGCVHCHAELAPRLHESTTVLTCPNGHGLFINAEALQAAVRDRADDRPESEEQSAEQQQGSFAARDLEANEGVRACPACGVEMDKRVFAYESGVPIDVCREHGIWLDDGELHRIEAWYEAQERYRAQDRAEWGGQDGRLEQIEQQHERSAADDHMAAHWGPVGWAISRMSYAWSRRDDA